MTKANQCGIACCSSRNKVLVEKMKIHPEARCECACKPCDRGFCAQDSFKIAKVGDQNFYFCSERCYYTWLYKK